MKRSRWSTRAFVVAAVVVFTGLARLAQAGPLLAYVRVESLDAAFRDAERLAKTAGKPLDRADMLKKALAPFGALDPSQVDLKRPLAVALPVEGMALSAQGLVAVLPVVSPKAALDSLGGQFKQHSVQKGLHVFSSFAGPSLYARVDGKQLVVGSSPDLVVRFDTKPLAKWNGPRGHIQMEVFLEPVAPTLEAQLLQAKEAIRARVEEVIPQNPSAPRTSTGAGPLLDLYFDWARAQLDNVSRVQAAAEVGGSHLLFRHRAVPKAGSTFARFVSAQKGGFPEVARRVEPGAAALVANVHLTEELRRILKDVQRRYLSALSTWLEELQQGAAEEDPSGSAMADFMRSYVAGMAELADRSLECTRGDLAASGDLSGGFSFVEVIGHKGGAACRSLLGDWVAKMRELLQKAPEAANLFTVQDGPRVGSAASYTFRMNPGAPGRSGSAKGPEAEELFRKLYGDEGFTFRMAALADTFLYAGGRRSEARLQALTAAPAPKGARGITPAWFRPLAPGAGVFGAVDLGAALRQIRALSPKDEPNPELDEAAKSLAGEAGRAALGLRIDASGAGFEAAVPLQALAVVRRLSSK